MNRAAIEAIAHTVLYEGHILYPYRASAKNRHRFTFGSLFPQAYAQAHASCDPSSNQTQCLVEGDDRTAIEVAARFLHLTTRTAGELTTPAIEPPPQGEPCWRPVSRLEIDGQVFQSWQETVEREVRTQIASIGGLLRQRHCCEFDFPDWRGTQALRDRAGRAAGILVRERRPIRGGLELSIEPVGNALFMLTAAVLNRTPMEDAAAAQRDDGLARSLIAAQTILTVSGGQFVSLMDPPAQRREAAARCRNVGVWPVLVGEADSRDTMLSAPIILYDYPRLAPQSPGDLFDATEIDEILTLRILTLTPDEQREAAALDPGAHTLLARSGNLTRESLLSLHGILRHPRDNDHE